ncbi:hypothetical protein WAI453_000787 [Rhynchosporium graminicola]
MQPARHILIQTKRHYRAHGTGTDYSDPYNGISRFKLAPYFRQCGLNREKVGKQDLRCKIKNRKAHIFQQSFIPPVSDNEEVSEEDGGWSGILVDAILANSTRSISASDVTSPAEVLVCPMVPEVDLHWDVHEIVGRGPRWRFILLFGLTSYSTSHIVTGSYNGAGG